MRLGRSYRSEFLSDNDPRLSSGGGTEGEDRTGEGVRTEWLPEDACEAGVPQFVNRILMRVGGHGKRVNGRVIRIGS